MTSPNQEEAESVDVKSMLLSQIILSYEENGKSYTMYSYTEAAARGQINVKYVKNGIRVEYAMVVLKPDVFFQG